MGIMFWVLFPPQLLFLFILTMYSNCSRNKHHHPNDVETFLMNASVLKTVFIKICSARLWQLIRQSLSGNFPKSSRSCFRSKDHWFHYKPNLHILHPKWKSCTPCCSRMILYLSWWESETEMLRFVCPTGVVLSVAQNWHSILSI